MATIVGVETDGGAVLAGDRLRVEEGTVRSRDARHVFDFGAVGAAAVGETDAVEEFRRRLEAEIRSHDTEHDDPTSLGRLATVASNLASEGVEAVVAGREDGRARVRGVDAGGGIVTDDRFAFGSGAELALGVLESGEAESVTDAAELAREAIAAAADRDTGTGEEIDVYRLESESELG
ncbi:Ntn hydrolase family protein [Halorussus halobius]|uniref:20S proteasome subunit A/B n=1 Tax=Halorussus halobius TaxID=1710537 RepID=UPI001092363A|nr:20S proteasome subunit A/B [Halorussus halobius]